MKGAQNLLVDSGKAGVIGGLCVGLASRFLGRPIGAAVGGVVGGTIVGGEQGKIVCTNAIMDAVTVLVGA
jgi:hypothetical protein